MLFYGGCHAQVLQRVFRDHGTVPDARYDCVVNFRLIGAGRPFPLAQALACDAVVLSPILSQKDYLTADLVPRLREGGVRVVTYPWLQWQGYFPLVRKAPFLGLECWHHARLPPEVWAAPPDEWPSRAMAHLADPALLEENLARTTQALQRSETQGGCDVRVSEHILAHYRSRRLFMTPDHPSKALYEVVVRAVSAALGIGIHEDWYASAAEPQDEHRTPIPRTVSDALSLTFHDGDFFARPSPVARRLPQSGYWHLLQGTLAGGTLWQAQEKTWLKRRPVGGAKLGDDERQPVAAGQVVMLVDGRLAQGHHIGRLHWHAEPGGARHAVPPWPETCLNTKHWAPLQAPAALA